MQTIPVQALNCVLVSHEDPVLRLGLATALQQSQFRDSVHACSPKDADVGRLLEFASVVVTDYENGLELCRKLRDQFGSRPSPTQVIVVSSRDGEHEIRSAIDGGVKGYLLAGCELEEFLEGVRIVSQGVRHLCSAAAHRMVDSMSRETLTTREIQVLRCLVDGYVNKRICDELNIALGTVKAHVKSIFSKLGVATRTQAVSMARSRGIVSSSGFTPAPRRAMHALPSRATSPRTDPHMR